jgi:hypothetical protein
MKIVALNHEKCRYCPLSLGNQERKELYLKKEQYEERKIVVGFHLFLESDSQEFRFSTFHGQRAKEWVPFSRIHEHQGNSRRVA